MNGKPEQLQLDLTATAAAIRMAPSLSLRPTVDGRGLEMRAETPTAWVSVATAAAMLGMDKEALRILLRQGDILGRQPNKPLDAVKGDRKTNHKWEVNAASVLAYKAAMEAAAETARARRYGICDER